MKSQRDDIGRILADRHGLVTVELKILGLLMKGLTRKEIAYTLDLSVHTVDVHITSMYRKLGVKNGHEAIAKVLSYLNTPLPPNVFC